MGKHDLHAEPFAVITSLGDLHRAGYGSPSGYGGAVRRAEYGLEPYPVNLGVWE